MRKLSTQQSGFLFLYNWYQLPAMSSTQSASSYKNFKYRVTADILCMRLNRTGFKYKIMWKRRQNKAQTRVIQHNQPQSFVNERLTLDFNIQYDTRTGKFMEKHIDFLPTIITETGLRSGGYGRIDLAETLNQGQTRVQKIIPLTKCPDPSATIEVTIQYVNLGETDQVEESVFMNSSMDFDSSRSKQKPEKFNTDNPARLPPMSPRAPVNLSDDKLSRQVQQLQLKLQSYQSREKQLVAQNAKHINDLQNMQRLSQAKDLQLTNKAREIIPLKEAQRQLQRAQSELREKDKIIESLNMRLAQSNQQRSQNRGDFRGAQRMDDFTKRIEDMEKINAELQNQLSQSNMKLAKIFNAAVEIGGPNLLDTLQNSIGMND